MRRTGKNMQPPPFLLITGKFRDRLTRSTLVTIRHKYVRVDLTDSAVREALAHAIKPWVSLAKGIPPALVGSARRISSMIGAYEKKISNYDLVVNS